MSVTLNRQIDGRDMRESVPRGHIISNLQALIDSRRVQVKPSGQIMGVHDFHASEFEIIEKTKDLSTPILKNALLSDFLGDDLRLSENTHLVSLPILSLLTTNTVASTELGITDVAKQKAIVDLRSNTGGAIASVDEILSQLLPVGTPLYYLQSKANNYVVAKGGSRQHFPQQIVVLVDKDTVSAAEMIADILEYYGATIMCDSRDFRTTGQKGSTTLSKRTQTEIFAQTIDRLHRPDGRTVEGKGVANVKLLPVDYVGPDNVDPLVAYADEQMQLNPTFGMIKP